MSFDSVVVFIAFVVFVLASVYWQRKRRNELALLAKKLGLQFDKRNDSRLIERYPFLNKLDRGSNRYAFNILSGNYQGYQTTVFDFHYETHSNKNTHHHYFSFFILTLDRQFPELTVGREGFFSKIGQSLGFDDIDFESSEFSKKFLVRSKDKKFAYDFCNAKMIEHLLDNPIRAIEIEETVLAMAFDSKLSVNEIEPQLNYLLKVRSLMPAYLFT